MSAWPSGRSSTKSPLAEPMWRFLGTDLGRLPRLIGLADTTRRIIGQNVWLAFGLSVVLIALAARGVLDPLTGALAQSVAVLVVVANSARILRFAGAAPSSPAG